MSMNIFDSSRRKVRCISNDSDVFEGGYSNLLEVGKLYTVQEVCVRSFHTKVYLEELPGAYFNSVLFEELDEENTEYQNSVDKFRCPKPPKMDVLNARFTVSGIFDTQHFSDILKNYIQDGTLCEIDVSIDMTGPKPILQMK